MFRKGDVVKINQPHVMIPGEDTSYHDMTGMIVSGPNIICEVCPVTESFIYEIVYKVDIEGMKTKVLELYGDEIERIY